MTTIEAARGSRLSHRLIPVAAGLWNALGVLGFTIVASRNPDALAAVPPPVIDWLDSMPSWIMLPWMAAVGGGFCGALLLLERSRVAVAAFAGSLAGLGLVQFWLFEARPPAALTTPLPIAMAVIIWAAALVQLRYAWRQWRAGVLR